MFKVCSKDIRTWSIGIGSGVFIVNFKHVQPINIVFLLITLNMCLFAGTSYTNLYSKPYEISLMELPGKTVNSLKYFCKELYLMFHRAFSTPLLCQNGFIVFVVISMQAFWRFSFIFMVDIMWLVVDMRRTDIGSYKLNWKTLIQNRQERN